MKHEQGDQDRVWIINHDQILLAEALQQIIEDFWGRRTILFEDGFKVMQWIEEARGGCYDGPAPELILTTWRMPGPQGPEVCRELRQTPELSDISIVMISAKPLSPEEEQMIMALVDGFLRPPFSVDDFRTAIDAVLEARQRKVSGQ